MKEETDAMIEFTDLMDSKDDSRDYQELMIVCKHSYRNGKWGSILNEKFSHPPSRFKGGCWICDVCKKSIDAPENEIGKAVFTDFAIAVRQALEMGRLPNKPEMFIIPDLTSKKNSINWTPELIKDTKLLYSKDDLYSRLGTLLAKQSIKRREKYEGLSA